MPKSRSSDPRPMRRTANIWTAGFLITAVLALVTGLYLHEHRVANIQRDQEPDTHNLAGARGTTEDADRASPPDGRGVFAANCVACHQTDGEGIAGLYPPLARSEWVVGPEGRVVRILLDGLSGNVSARGAKFNSVMPAFRGLLGDEEIAAVLTFVRASWNNNAEAVSAQSVRVIRSDTAGRQGNWTATELDALP